jgi:hypothetical protein
MGGIVYVPEPELQDLIIYMRGNYYWLEQMLSPCALKMEILTVSE